MCCTSIPRRPRCHQSSMLQVCTWWRRCAAHQCPGDHAAISLQCCKSAFGGVDVLHISGGSLSYSASGALRCFSFACSDRVVPSMQYLLFGCRSSDLLAILSPCHPRLTNPLHSNTPSHRHLSVSLRCTDEGQITQRATPCATLVAQCTLCANEVSPTSSCTAVGRRSSSW